MNPATQEAFDIWLSLGQVTRYDFDLTVADLGFAGATMAVNQRIAVLA